MTTNDSEWNQVALSDGTNASTAQWTPDGNYWTNPNYQQPYYWPYSPNYSPGFYYYSYELQQELIELKRQLAELRQEIDRLNGSQGETSV